MDEKPKENVVSVMPSELIKKEVSVEMSNIIDWLHKY